MEVNKLSRPKGSKNKPKVAKIDTQGYVDRLVQQDDLIRRQKKVIEESKYKLDTKQFPRVLSPSMESMATQGASDEKDEIDSDPNEIIVHDAVQTDTDVVGLKRPAKSLKQVIEKVEFLVGEVTNLRSYIRKLEDAFVIQYGKENLPEDTLFTSPVKKHRHKISKPSTNEPEQKEEVSKNEKETE